MQTCKFIAEMKENTQHEGMKAQRHKKERWGGKRGGKRQNFSRKIQSTGMADFSYRELP